MSTRKERKEIAKARLQAERAADKTFAAEIADLPQESQNAAKTERKNAAKHTETARKAALKELPSAERKAAKKQEKVYKKIKHRPRRAIGWGIFGAAVIGVGFVAAPYVSDISRLFSLKIDSNTAEGIEARKYGQALAEEISDEGIVLLKNDGDALPLVSDKVNVFSFASFNLRYGGGGSGGADQSTAVTLYDALEQQGISYNQDLYKSMQDAGATHGDGSGNGLMAIAKLFMGSAKASEPAPDYLTDTVMDQAKGFSDTAIIVVGNDGVESSDFTVEELRPTDEVRALLDRVTGTFDNVIVVVNSGNQMELGFLDEYPQIKGALSIGTPGPRGAVSLAKILDGSVNPSGRLTSTYAYDVSTAPATENFGDFKHSNANRGYYNYSEGIYVGYRYYETRYAGDEAGYAAAVQYPFGYGLSYTDFSWDVSLPQITDDSVTFDVKVTNTGAVAGKDVVQAYFEAPYTPGGIEKSAIELAGYAKTGVIEPGASETVSVSFNKRDMSSWDTSRGAYVLEPGTYEVGVYTDIHSPAIEVPVEVETEVVFSTDDTTGTTLQNQFDYAKLDVTELSRNDWDGTYPDAADNNSVASEDVLARMNPNFEYGQGGDAPTTGAENGLKLADMKGLSYDDPKWDEFLDQFTIEELNAVFSTGAYQTIGVERLGVPAAILLDGPAGLNFFFGDVTAASFPTEVVIASSWNDELAYKLGEAVGKEANAYGVQGWYAPGMNLHRTALGGRNFEYFSEDPLLSGKMAAGMVSGAQDQGVLTFMKHFALNEQETNARSGVNVFVNEQAMRELYLRPFEITVKEGDAWGAMSSFINIGGSWAGGNEELLQNVLRDEWGFEGVVSTDAVLGGFMNPSLALRYGNDLMLGPLPSQSIKKVEKDYKNDPVGVTEGLRDRVHAVMFALLRTDAVQ